MPVLGKPAAPPAAAKDAFEPLDMALDLPSPRPASPATSPASARPDLLAIDFGDGATSAPRPPPETAPTFAPEAPMVLDVAPRVADPPPGRGTPPAPIRSSQVPRLTPAPPTKALPSVARATPPAPAHDGSAAGAAVDPVTAVFSPGVDATQPPVDMGGARPHRPSLEARAGKSRGTGSWADVATDVIQVKGVGRPPAAADAEALRRPGGGAQGNVFPREAVKRAKDELLLWVRRAPPKTRYQIIAALATPPFLWIVFLAWAFWPGYPTYYVTESQPLLVGPAAGEVYPALSPVDRGGRVELVDDVGEYSLVRDSLGRVGYVRARDLGSSAPQALPSQPFADCVRAPVPGATEICQRRAQDQFEDCRKVCRRADDASCADHCQKRFADCLGTCEQLEPETPPPAPAVAATPRPEPPKAVKREEPSVPDPAAETHPKAKKLVKAKKKTK